MDSKKSAAQSIDKAIGQAMEAQSQGNWPEALACWERVVAAQQGAVPDATHLAHAHALYANGRLHEAWDVCARLLRDTRAYAPPVISLLSRLDYKLGHYEPMITLLEALEARNPVPRNALMLRMMISGRRREIVKTRRAITTLLQQDLTLREFELIFASSAQVYPDIERGILLAQILGRLEAMLDRADVDQGALHLLIARIFVTLNAPVRAQQALKNVHAPAKNHLAAKTRWMAGRLLDKNYPDFNAPKVFCIGLSKTGTSSLDTALGILGIYSEHWTNTVTASILGVQDCLLFDAASDVSISYRFELLYQLFPNAKFIYTKRPLESWERSFLRHYWFFGETFPEMQAATAREPDRKRGLESDVIDQSLYFNHDSAESAYHAFDQRVRQFFSDKPGRLLSMNIFAGDSWEKLCDFLGRPVPERPFPHKNATAVSPGN